MNTLNATRFLTLVLACLPVSGCGDSANKASQTEFARGKAAFEKQDWIGAIAALDRARYLGGSDEVLYYLGCAHARAGNAQDAVRWLESFLRRVPQSAHAEAALDLLAGLTGDYGLGSNSAETTNTDSAAAFRSGILAGQRQDFATAATELQRASEAHPDNPLISYNLGIALAKQGDFQTGATCLEKSLAGNIPKVERAWIQDAITQLSFAERQKMGQATFREYRDAWLLLSKTIGFSDADALTNAAVESSAQQFRSALAESPGNTEILRALSLTEENRLRFVVALAWTNAALASHPNGPQRQMIEGKRTLLHSRIKAEIALLQDAIAELQLHHSTSVTVDSAGGGRRFNIEVLDYSFPATCAAMAKAGDLTGAIDFARRFVPTTLEDVNQPSDPGGARIGQSRLADWFLWSLQNRAAKSDWLGAMAAYKLGIKHNIVNDVRYWTFLRSKLARAFGAPETGVGLMDFLHAKATGALSQRPISALEWIRLARQLSYSPLEKDYATRIKDAVVLQNNDWDLVARRALPIGVPLPSRAAQEARYRANGYLNLLSELVSAYMDILALERIDEGQ